jgi:excisionase family DNA binding protein
MSTNHAPLRSTAKISANLANLTEMLLNRWLSLSEEDREREFVNTARAAKIAGVARRTMQQWIKTGKIAAVPIGRKYRIVLESLEKHLKLSAHSWTVKRRRFR